MNKKRLFLCLFAILVALPMSLSAQWSQDQKLSTLDTSAGLNENMGQCLAVSGDSIHVVWTNTLSGARGVYYKHSFDGGLTWTGETKLTGPTCDADLPSIAVSGSTVHIMWRDTIGAQNVNYYIRSLDGGNTWEPKVFFGNWYWWPSITCSGSMVFVALNSSTPGNTEVWFQRSMDNGTTWDSVKRISNALGRSEDPSISVSDGHVYLVWNDNRDSVNGAPKMQAYGRISSDNGVTWGPETLWNNPPSKSYFPFVHASGPNVDFAWGDLRGVYQLYYKHSTDYGATWSAEQQVSPGTAGGDYPVVTRNGSDVYVEWFLFGGGAVTYRHSGDGGNTWDASVDLVSGASNPGSPFMVASGSTLHTIWLDQRDGYHAVYYKRNPPMTSTKFVAPAIVSFGEAKAKTSAFDTITLQNTGGTTINVLNYSIDPNAGAFALAGPLTYAIPAGGSVSIVVRFSPLAAQMYSATLTIQTDESASSFSKISLTGIGVCGTRTLQSVSSPLDFGSVDSGSSKTLDVVLTNNGCDSITIVSLYINGSSYFSINSIPLPLRLSAGASYILHLSFMPLGSGEADATLSIYSNADSSTSLIALRGTGVGKKDTTGGGTAIVRSITPALSEIEVMPNPAITTATLRIGVVSPLEDVSIHFFDVAGREMQTQYIGSLGVGTQRIPLSLPPATGIAFVRVLSAGRTVGTAAVAVTR